MTTLLVLAGLVLAGAAATLVAAIVLFVVVDALLELVADFAAKRHFARKEGRP